MQSLAAFTGADFRAAGALDYINFLWATQFGSNDVWEKAIAFELIVQCGVQQLRLTCPQL